MSTSKGSIPELVAAVASGRSLEETARAAGLSVSSVQRRLRDPAVVEAVEQTRAAMTQQAAGRVANLRELAFDRIGRVLVETSDEALGLRACELVLRHAAAIDTASLQQRVLLLEQQLQRAEETRSEARMHEARRDARWDR